MKGLEFRRTADAIAAFVKQHGALAPRRAVLCTYDLDPARFEAIVLPELTRRRRWFRTLVFADAASLQRQGVLTQRGAASSYELAPVRVNGAGVFHSKLIVLQAGTRVLVGIGSGNLTAGGLGGNLELMLFARNEGVDGTALAESALAFLDKLRTTRRTTLPASAKRFLDRVCQSMPAANGGPVPHSLDRPLIEQLTAGRPGRIRRVQVMTPWHSTSADTDGIVPEVLAQVGKALGVPPEVYTQGHVGKAPALGKKTKVRILRASAFGGDEDQESESEEDPSKRVRRPARLHAKAYLAHGTTNATLWFGSANCTQPALCRVAGPGNVELLAQVSLDRSALARLERDLEVMFEHPVGTLPVGKTPRIPAPRGNVLAGHVDTWEGAPKLEIELIAQARSPRLRIGPTARRQATIELAVARGATSLVLSQEQNRRLLQDREVPPMLWEHLGGAAVPFPISVPCAPRFEDAEAMLDDVLDDFAGRVPCPFRTTSRTEDEDDEDDGDTDDHDRELEMLTESEHQGALDRIAVRVELLRQRLAAAPAARSYYVTLVEGLAVPRRLRSILVDHLRSRGAT